MIAAQIHILDRFLLKESRLCKPKTSLKEKVIKDLDEGTLAGHFERDKITASLEKRDYWPQLGKDVTTIVRSCPVC